MVYATEHPACFPVDWVTCKFWPQKPPKINPNLCAEKGTTTLRPYLIWVTVFRPILNTHAGTAFERTRPLRGRTHTHARTHARRSDHICRANRCCFSGSLTRNMRWFWHINYRVAKQQQQQQPSWVGRKQGMLVRRFWVEINCQKSAYLPRNQHQSSTRVRRGRL